MVPPAMTNLRGFTIYVPTSGDLFYDSDGRRTIAAELVAQLHVGLGLAWTDFAVI